MSGAAPASQPQRTGLAWTRTALAALGLAGLALRAAVGHHRPLDVLTAALACAEAVAVFLLGRYRASRSADPIPGAMIGAAVAACLVTSVAVTISVAAGG